MRDYDESAAAVEFEGGFPRTWAEAFARLEQADRFEMLMDALHIFHICKDTIAQNFLQPIDYRGLVPLIKGRPITYHDQSCVVVSKAQVDTKFFSRPGLIGGPAKWEQANEMGRRAA